MSDLVEQIDALLALNAKGAVSHPVPGLAVELLERAKAELSLRQSHSTGVVKGLEWWAVGPNWWVAQPSVMIGGSGYEVRITDSGKVRARRGSEDWFQFDGTADEAKAHWQANYESRILSALYTHPKEAEVTVTEEMLIADISNLVRAAWNLCDGTANENPPEVDQDDWNKLSAALDRLDALRPPPGVIAGPGAKVEYALVAALSRKESKQ